MKRNEFGRVQYVDIDKEGLDPKVSGSMVSKRIHEDTIPFIKVILYIDYICVKTCLDGDRQPRVRAASGENNKFSYTASISRRL